MSFVQQQQLDIARQCPRHRRHLLLAARHRHRFLQPSVGQPREMRVQAFDRAADRHLDLGPFQILLACQSAVDAAVFGYQTLASEQGDDFPFAHVEGIPAIMFYVFGFWLALVIAAAAPARRLHGQAAASEKPPVADEGADAATPLTD